MVLRRRKGGGEKPASTPVPSPPKDPPVRPKPPEVRASPPVKVGPAHYRALLPTYYRSCSPEVLNEFAARVRAELSAEEIREELLPMLPASSLGTTGVQISRLKAALERVASR